MELLLNGGILCLFVSCWYGPKGRCSSTFNLAEWGQREETRQAWAELKKEHGLESDPFDGPQGMWQVFHIMIYNKICADYF